MHIAAFLTANCSHSAISLQSAYVSNRNLLEHRKSFVCFSEQSFLKGMCFWLLISPKVPQNVANAAFLCAFNPNFTNNIQPIYQAKPVPPPPPPA
jgi:hypothetical protein